MDFDLSDFLHDVWASSTDWYWLIPFSLAVYNLGAMYTLEAPVSFGGRMARTAAYMAHILSFACLFYNGLWKVAFPLQMLAWAILNTQFYFECAIRRPRIRVDLSPGEKLVKSVVGKKTGNGAEAHH